MKKDLNIMMDGKPLRLNPESCINVEMQNSLTSNEQMRSGYFELIGKGLPTPVIDHNISLGRFTLTGSGDERTMRFEI